MALTIQRTSPFKTRIMSTFIMIFALMVQPLVGLNVPAAFADEGREVIAISPSAKLTINADQTVSVTANAAGYTDLELSFRYDIRDLESNKYLNYGWGIDSTPATILDAIEGEGGQQPAEVNDVVNRVIANEAGASNLTISFTNTGNSQSSDKVTVENVVLTGIVKATVLSPSVSIVTPRQNGVVPTVNRGNTLAVSGSFRDDKAVNYLQLELIRTGNLATVYTMHYNNPGLAPNGAFALNMPVPAELPSGEYSLFYTGTDFDGGVSERSQRTFTIDNTKPETDLIVPVKRAGNTFSASGTASDNSSLSRVYLQLVNRRNSQRYAGTTIHLSGTEQSWSRVFNATELNLPEGTYAAHVAVTDIAGNSANVGWSDDFTIDNTLPTVSIKAGTDINGGSLGSQSRYSRISFKLHDANGNLKEAVISNNVNGERTYTRSGVWNDLNWVNINKGHLSQGENSVVVRDNAGNESFPLVFTYDTITPTATFKYSNNNGNALTNQDVTVKMQTSESIHTPQGWTRENDDMHFTRVYSSNGKHEVVITDFAGNVSSAQKFEVKRIDRSAPMISGVTNGAIVSGVELVVTDPKYQGYDGFDGHAGLTANGEIVPATAVVGKTFLYKIAGDGYYEVIATDKAGNSTSVTFTVDETAPAATVEVISPAGAGNVHRNAVQVTGVVGPSEAHIKSHWFEVTNPDGSFSHSYSMNSDSLEYNFALDTSKGDGEYRIRYVATDKAGNRSDADEPTVKTIMVDNTGPSVQVDAIPVEGAIVNGGAITITGTVSSDDFGRYHYQLLDADKQPVTYSIVGGSNPVVSGTIGRINLDSLPSGLLAGQQLPDGIYYVRVWAQDVHGNQTGTKNVPHIAQFILKQIIGENVDGGIEDEDEEAPVDRGNATPNGGISAPIVGSAVTMSIVPNVSGVDTPAENDPVSNNESGNDEEDVLGDQANEESVTPLEDTGDVLGFMDNRLFNLAWYWYLVIFGALVGGWLFIAAAIRRRREQE